MSSISEDDGDGPLINYDTSKGSSVSSGLQEEYDELLKYALVTPKWEPSVTVQQNVTLPQLRLQEPDDLALTTVDEYSDNSSRTESEKREGHDSAMGSEEIATDRRTFRSSSQPSPKDILQGIPNLATSSLREEPSASRKQYESMLDASDNGDADIKRMYTHLSSWHTKMNSSVLAELSQIKITITENYRRQLHGMQQEHESERNKLQDEIANLKELLHTYDASLTRKDSVISNLTRALHSSKERQEMARALTHWKIRLVDEKRQGFTSTLARRHREHALAAKAWQGWRSLVEVKWREKVEKACQKKAQEVCMKLTDDYEAKLASINEALESSRDEVQRLHDERDRYEETMKKAFMRGVCALNLEAMTMFNAEEENTTTTEEVRTLAAAVDALTCASSDAEQPQRTKPAVNQTRRTGDSLLRNADPMMPRPTVSKVPAKTQSNPVRTNQQFSKPQSHGPVRIQAGRTSTLSAKVTGVAGGVPGPRSRSPNVSAPPSGSVLVERHHPNIQNAVTGQPLAHVTKQPNTPTQPIRSRDERKGKRSQPISARQ
uniref:Centrosomal protein POC5 n=1 Tax=Phallusia mammillata TaxID=59560 RepID=A0A6F9DP75_9ASCI|nr:centrosomal protein POC5 [Phallusia mammillata]